MMNNKWIQILVFSLLFGAVGFLLGRSCSGARCGGGGCEKSAAHCSRGEGAMAACGMSNCSHAGCEGGKAGACDRMGGKRGHHGNEHAGVQAAIDGIERSGFEGDTTFTHGDAMVTIRKNEGRMEVTVQKEKEIDPEVTE